MKVINLNQKFDLFTDQWSPKIIGELNGQDVKLAKLQGEFVWHDHKDEDELFLVLKGKLEIHFRHVQPVVLNAGELIIVPKGIEHKPVAREEVHVLLFEPSAIKHTGDVAHELTVQQFERI